MNDLNKIAVVSIQEAKSKSKEENATLRKAVLVVRAAFHRFRQRFIGLFEEQPVMTASDVSSKLKIDESLAEQELNILNRAGIVLTEKKDEGIYYSLNKNRLAHVNQIIEGLPG